jgi:DNA uptake protein ComE-like DNA-binding protein
MTTSAPHTAHGPRRVAGCGRSRRTAGQSLIVALVVLGFLTAVMGTVTIELLTESRITNTRQMEVTAFYVARAGIEAGVNQLLLAKSPGYESLGDAWHSNSQELDEMPLGPDKEHAVGRYKVACFDPAAGQERIGIADEEGRLNINKAEPAMLRRLDAAFTDDLVKAIVERREKRPFLTLNELNGVAGAPPHFMTKARESLLTVWGEGKVNINTAPPAVLASLGMDEAHVTKIEEFRKGTGDPAEMGVFKTLGDARSYLGMDDKWLTTSSSHFSITAQGYLVDDPGIVCKLREVVQRGPEGLQVLRFEQVPLGSK